MAPEYDKLFDIYKEKRNDIVIARLEGSLNEEVSMKYGIYSFPMIILFHPNNDHINSLFQGQRIAQAMSDWIETNTKVEEKKMLEEKKINSENLDQNLIIVKANKTEVTDEFEFIKREIITLKNRVEKLENEIENFKKDKKNFMKEIEMPSYVTLFSIIGLGIILIGLFLTIKKLIYGKTNLISGETSTHAKV